MNCRYFTRQQQQIDHHYYYCGGCCCCIQLERFDCIVGVVICLEQGADSSPHLGQDRFPFCYRLTQVILEKRLINECSSSSNCSIGKTLPVFSLLTTECECAKTTNYYYNNLTASFPRQPGWAGSRKVKPIWMLLEQETVSGSGISWAICKSAPSSRQITMPVPHHSVFYRPDALPATQPTASKHWRQKGNIVRTALCSVVYDSCAQRYAHKYEQFFNLCLVRVRLVFGHFKV